MGGVVSTVLGGVCSVVGSLFGASMTAKDMGIDIQRGKGKEFHCEMEDGRRWSILVKYVVIHPDKSLVGRSFAIGRVGSHDPTILISPDPNGDGSVVFQLSEDESNVQRLFAINTLTTTDYWITFNDTPGTGSGVATVQVLLPKAPNKYKPIWVDITKDFGDYQEGNFVLSATQPPPSSDLQAVISKMQALGLYDQIKAVLPTSTLLGSYAINNVVASATYNFAFGAAHTLHWAWIVNSDNAISGVTVTSTSPTAANVSGTLNWTNPVRGETFNFAINGTGTNGGVTNYSFPGSNNSPIGSVQIALNAATSSFEEREALIKGVADKQLASGKSMRVKYMYM